MELYDPACEDLARYFLEYDEAILPAQRGVHETRVVSLATAIQETIEAWLEDEPRIPRGSQAGSAP